MSGSEHLEKAIIRAYAIIGRATPIKADCGLLCGAACCKDAPTQDAATQDTATLDTVTLDAVTSDIPTQETPASDALKPDAPSSGTPASGALMPDASTLCALTSDVPIYAQRAPDALGMVLFPGEVNLLSHEPGYRLFKIPYMGAGCWFLVCEGICDRRKRPLACRIFPLAPHISETGNVSAAPDPRAMRVCPLADGEYLDPAFRKAVTKTFRYLAEEPEIFEYMQLLSADLDDMRRFVNKKYKR